MPDFASDPTFVGMRTPLTAVTSPPLRLSSDPPIVRIWESPPGYWNVDCGDAHFTGRPELLAYYYAQVLAKLQELHGIVDGLPRCWRLTSFGALVRDVPMFPGMAVWTCDRDNGHQVMAVFSCRVQFIGDETGCRPETDCFSSAEARDVYLRRKAAVCDISQP